MKVIKTNPGAKRLMESLRNMGYDCSTAIADLVDNSVTANASEIHIDIIPKQHSDPARIVIIDNGKGMDREELHEAMRFGAMQEYQKGDLGKYGLGLKTASLSQCRTLTVSSKSKSVHGSRPRRHTMVWDIDHVYKTDDWNLLCPDENELKSWQKEALDHPVLKDNGTAIVWSKLEEALPLLSSDDIHEREKFLAYLIDEISGHLRMVFHRFMHGTVTGRRKLNIFICGERLIPWDPFCRDEKTKELDIVDMKVISQQPDGEKVKENIIVSPYVLPREDEFSSAAAWKDASGPKNWNQQQGLYFYRNNRLLQAGGWSRLRAVDEHTKLLRIAVDFPSELDLAFSINITKMRAKIPDELREKMGSYVSKWAKTARVRYDGTSQKHDVKSAYNRPVIEPAPSVNIGPLVFSKNSSGDEISISEDKAGQINLSIPEKHDLSAIFELKNGDKEELKKLCLAAFSLLEAVYERKIPASHIPMAAIKKIYKNL